VFGYGVDSSIVVGIVKSVVGCEKYLKPKIKVIIQLSCHTAQIFPKPQKKWGTELQNIALKYR
jgi:hypothetical protein